MGSSPQERSKAYTGPLTVEVPIEQWDNFIQHAPGWWPSGKDFVTPDVAVLRRVHGSLMQKLGAASDEECSPTMARLRLLVRDDNRRIAAHGPLGQWR